MNDIHHGFARQGLTRPTEGRVLGGVVAGLGRRLGIAPWPARILFVLLLMVIPGSQILIYPILWILMPSEQAVMLHQPSTPPTAAASPRTFGRCDGLTSWGSPCLSHFPSQRPCVLAGRPRNPGVCPRRRLLRPSSVKREPGPPRRSVDRD